MSKRPTVIFAYLALLLFSLPIPFLHEGLADKAIETMRPVLKFSDGSLSAGLMPADILLFRWLGQISWIVVCVVAVFFVLSFLRAQFAQFTMICVVAIGQCAFTTLYAFYAAFLLSEFWIHRVV